MDNVVLN
jgi:hypothetical protein